MTNKKKYKVTKNEYTNNQQRLLNGLFIRQIKLMIPIEIKLFQNKFIKLAQFEDDDSNDVVLGKINNNIQMYLYINNIMSFHYYIVLMSYMILKRNLIKAQKEKKKFHINCICSIKI